MEFNKKQVGNLFSYKKPHYRGAFCEYGSLLAAALTLYHKKNLPEGVQGDCSDKKKEIVIFWSGTISIIAFNYLEFEGFKSIEFGAFR